MQVLRRLQPSSYRVMAAESPSAEIIMYQLQLQKTVFHNSIPKFLFGMLRLCSVALRRCLEWTLVHRTSSTHQALSSSLGARGASDLNLWKKKRTQGGSQRATNNHKYPTFSTILAICFSMFCARSLFVAKVATCLWPLKCGQLPKSKASAVFANTKNTCELWSNLEGWL